jgi:hypothetical protein
VITAELINHYAAGGQRLEQAVRGLVAADMDVPSEPGTWSIRHVVVHLSDAEAAFGDRIRRILATENPALLAWDHDAYPTATLYDAQSAEAAVVMVDVGRRQLARVLEKLPPSAFARFGTHSERGRQTLADVILSADRHLDHHLKFIAEKRERLGKLMW